MIYSNNADKKNAQNKLKEEKYILNVTENKKNQLLITAMVLSIILVGVIIFKKLQKGKKFNENKPDIDIQNNNSVNFKTYE